MFQDPRLLPWATARENIAYPLRIAGTARKVRHAHAATVARRVSLDAADIDKFPVELSGGVRQRVAIARALARDPDLVFFDEPFTALDVALKRRMQNLVISAAATARFAALFVTHDLFEATPIAHRIVVMDARGRGIAGERIVPGLPGQRPDREVFEQVSGYLSEDPLFGHVNDVDERRPG